MVYRWEVYLKVSGWMSEYRSVDNLLRYLKYRKIGSEGSRDNYGRVVHAFCQFAGKLPDELAVMKRADIEDLVEEFCYHKKESGCCPRTVNTALFILKTFFKVNGFKKRITFVRIWSIAKHMGHKVSRLNNHFDWLIALIRKA